MVSYVVSCCVHIQDPSPDYIDLEVVYCKLNQNVGKVYTTQYHRKLILHERCSRNF